MKVGEQVLRYQHESNDLGPDVVRDELAFVTRVVDDHVIDVVIFPAGGPTKYERLYAFDPDSPYNQPGGIYFRGVEEAPPKFDDVFHYHQFPDYSRMVAEQKRDYDMAPSQVKEGLKEKHAQQQAEMQQQLDAPAKPNPVIVDAKKTGGSPQRTDKEKGLGADDQADTSGRRV